VHEDAHGQSKHPKNLGVRATHFAIMCQARALNELWREHLFQLAITFHGGMEAITYEWGSPNHPRGKDTSPDDTAQAQITKGGYGRLGSDDLEEGISTSAPEHRGNWRAYGFVWCLGCRRAVMGDFAGAFGTTPAYRVGRINDVVSPLPRRPPRATLCCNFRACGMMVMGYSVCVHGRRCTR
jgi:hypothetical protein